MKEADTTHENEHKVEKEMRVVQEEDKNDPPLLRLGGPMASSTNTTTEQRPSSQSQPNPNNPRQRRRPKRQGRHGAKNQHKSKFFVRWLLQTFPHVLETVQHSVLLQQPSEQEPNDTLENNNTTQTTSIHSKTTITNADESHDQDSSSVQQFYTQPLLLDIAGGKGEVAARLIFCHQQRVVLVDPRDMRNKKTTRSSTTVAADTSTDDTSTSTGIASTTTSSSFSTSSTDNIVTCYRDTIVRKSLPQKWQHQVQQKLQHNPHYLHNIAQQRFRHLPLYFDVSTTTTSGTTMAGDPKHKHNPNHPSLSLPPSPATQVQSSSSSSSFVASLHTAIQHAQLLIGLHADSATEQIVDIALQYGKPFVVVPCCVFPSFFPHRQVRIHESYNQNEELQAQQGQARNTTVVTTTSTTTTTTPTRRRPVRTYEDFCTYLVQKDHRFHQTILPFEGRNIAIWWEGDTQKSS
jgi:hypothetical protein